MNRAPTLKKLTDFGMDKAHAQKFRKLVHAGQLDSAMDFAADCLDMDVQSLYPEFPDVWYLNTGETYNITLLRIKNNVYLRDWGSYVEAQQR